MPTSRWSMFSLPVLQKAFHLLNSSNKALALHAVCGLLLQAFSCTVVGKFLCSLAMQLHPEAAESIKQFHTYQPQYDHLVQQMQWQHCGTLRNYFQSSLRLTPLVRKMLGFMSLTAALNFMWMKLRSWCLTSVEMNWPAKRKPLLKIDLAAGKKKAEGLH